MPTLKKNIKKAHIINKKIYKHFIYIKNGNNHFNMKSNIFRKYISQLTRSPFIDYKITILYSIQPIIPSKYVKNIKKYLI